MKNPKVLIHVLPGGSMPKRQTTGAIGYDAHIRALVSATEMDPEVPILRRTLFDFQHMPEDPHIAEHVVSRRKNGQTELVYRLDPNESVLVGIGFTTEMPFPLFYWIAPRSGLSSKHKLTVTNAPGTVDPDYRGEAGALIHNRAHDKPFFLERGMRIVQVIFQWAVLPEIREVKKQSELSDTNRGTGGFGSTGV